MNFAFTLLLLSLSYHPQVFGPRWNSVVWSLLGYIEMLNPFVSTDAYSGYVQQEIWETLNSNDPRTLALIPSLASLPKVSKDHLTYTYTMDPRAKWSDGQPVTSADVIYSMKAVMNPLIQNSHGLREYLDNVDSVYIPNGDPSKVAFKLNLARWNEPMFLGTYVRIMPKHTMDPKNLTELQRWEDLKSSENASQAVSGYARWQDSVSVLFDPQFLVGSGPYIFNMKITNDRTILVRNPEYWAQKIKGFEAYPDSLIFKTISDPIAAIDELNSGNIDVLEGLKNTHYTNNLDAATHPNVRKAAVYYNNYSYIGWNNRNPLFADARVRKALTMLIDRDLIIKHILKGEAKKVDGPVPSTQPDFDSTVHQPAYNVAEAKRLLKEAGWADTDGDGVLDKVVDGEKRRFEFTFQVNAGNDTRKQILLAIAESLRTAGIRASVKALEWSVFLDNTRAHNFDASYGAWAGNATEDDIYQLWHSSQIENKGSNFYGYSSAVADKLMEQIRQEFDQEKRHALSHQLQHQIVEDQPVSFLFTSPDFIGYSARFENVEFFRTRPCFDPRYWVAKDYASKRGIH